MRASVPAGRALVFVPARRAELYNVAATSRIWLFAFKLVKLK